MINIIKTAIVTIIISFISGLLLEYYKNLAPRILCNIRTAMPRINNIRTRAYIITVNNVSNKTIHELTLNISSQNNLKIANAKITRGLKFNSSVKDNILDVCIPFLSKEDKFSVTVYGENQYAMRNKPVIVIRSPEKFKQIDSLEQKGILASLLNIPKNISQAISNVTEKPETSTSNEKNDFTKVMSKPLVSEGISNRGNKKTPYRNNRPGKNKKAILIAVSIILLVFVGALGKSYFKKTSANTPTPDTKTVVPNQSTNITNSSGETTKNTGSRTSNGGAARSTGSRTSTGGATKNSGSSAATGGATQNSSSSTSTEETSGNTGSKASTGRTIQSSSSKASAGGAAQNSGSGASTGGTAQNSGSSTATGGAAQNTGSGTSTGGTTQNSGN